LWSFGWSDPINLFSSSTAGDSGSIEIGAAPSIVNVCVYTSSAQYADTPGGVTAKLQTDAVWSDAVQVFTSASKATKTCVNIDYSGSFPTAVELAIDSTNGWGYWKVTIDGCTVVEHADGQSGVWFLDIGSTEGWPESKILAVPSECISASGGVNELVPKSVRFSTGGNDNAWGFSQLDIVDENEVSCEMRGSVDLCVDTPGWDNGSDQGCSSYVGSGWCANGAAKAGKEWTVTPDFNNPDQNCCACGKGEWAPSAVSADSILDPYIA
jgi:hypothetical protein